MAATAVDYGLILGWAVALAALILSFTDLAQQDIGPWTGQTLGLVTLTLPTVALLAWAEAHGGSPGKRLLGLRLHAVGARELSYGRAWARSVAKIGLPWELSHAGIWQAYAGGSDTLAVVAIAASYLALIIAAIGLIRLGAPWYDRWLHTTVHRCAS